MPETYRCNVNERIETWPYVKKCRNVGVHEISDSIAEELDISTEEGIHALVCDTHMEIMRNAGWTAW